MFRSKNPHILDYSLLIHIRGGHNHAVTAAAALRYRDVDESIRQKFEQLFQAGCSPSAAYHLHQFDLHDECGSQYYLVSGDRRYSPDKSWCYRFVTCTSG